jgi:hypothetical protein
MGEASGVHRNTSGWRSHPGNDLVQSVKALGIQSFDSSVEEGVAGWTLKTQSGKQLWLEGKPGHEITKPKSGIKLEAKEDKQPRERELHRSTTVRPDIRNGIAKAHKLLKEIVKTANFGRVV